MANTRHDSFSSAVEEADRLFDLDRITDAGSLYQRAEEVAPDPSGAAWARKNVGICARRIGNSAEALDHANKALRTLLEDDEVPGLRAEIWLLIGNCDADLENFADAELALDEAARLFRLSKRFEDEIQAHLSMARVLAERGDTGGAVALLETVDPASLSGPLRSQVLNNLGLLYRRTGRTQDALRLLHEDIALCESRKDLYGAAVAGANLGITLAELGFNQEAKEILATSASRLRDLNAGSAVQEVQHILARLEDET